MFIEQAETCGDQRLKIEQKKPTQGARGRRL
jgi:hypothetical protein